MNSNNRFQKYFQKLKFIILIYPEELNL